MRRFITGALLALLLFVSPLSAQITATAPADSNRTGAWVGPNNVLVQGALAVTACGEDGLPVTHYRPDVPLDTLLNAQIVAHEAVHRAQLAPDSTGTCAEKFARATATPLALLTIEAPAYCAQIAVADEQGGPQTDDLQYFQKTVLMLTTYLRQAYIPNDSTVPPISPGDVAHVLFEHCRPRYVSFPNN